jgi:hypothetical protein
MLAQISIGGVFSAEIKRHRLMSKAVESGDPNHVLWAAKVIKSLPGCNCQYDVVATEEVANLIPNQGLDNLLGVWCTGGAQVQNRYVSLFSQDSTPSSAWTSGNYHNVNTTEWIGYAEGSRPLWQKGSVSAQSVNNSGNKAVFTSTGSATLYGAALLSAMAKDGTGDGAGILYAATRFTAPRAVVATDIINIQYTLAATSS